MTTVIDSLVIELGLDPKKFTAGQKSAMEAFKKAQEEATGRAKLIEAAGARAGQFFSKLRTEAVGFAALLIGGRGLKDFVADTITANASVGRLAKTMDIAPRTLAQWRTAFYLGGASAEGVTATLQGLTAEIQQFQLTGQSSILPYLSQLETGFVDVNGNLKTADKLFLDISNKISKMDPARAAEFGKVFHMDNDTINVAIRGVAAIQALLAEAKKLKDVTDASAEAAARLQKEWRKAETASEGWGQALLDDLTPALETAAGLMTKFFSFSVELRNKNKQSWRDWIDGRQSSVGRGGATMPILPPSANVKSGAGGGDISLGVAALMASLQNSVPGARFTALNDAYHAGTSSKHAKGLALDLTTSGDHAAVSAAIRSMLGPGATVLDEYDPKQRSARSTGPHIHVQFNSPEDAARYARSAGPGGGTTNNRTSNSTSDVKIGAVNISVPTARDAADVSRVWKSVDEAMLASPANYGLR